MRVKTFIYDLRYNDDDDSDELYAFEHDFNGFSKIHKILYTTSEYIKERGFIIYQVFYTDE